jgi:MFS superfamily sulfate permease-like transporter
MALAVGLLLRTDMEEERVGVIEGGVGEPYLRVDSSVTFLKAAKLHDKLDGYLAKGEITTIDLRSAHHIDSMGAAMLKTLKAEYPALSFCVAKKGLYDKLVASGIPRQDVSVTGAQTLDMREIFRQVQEHA